MQFQNMFIYRNNNISNTRSYKIFKNPNLKVKQTIQNLQL